MQDETLNPAESPESADTPSAGTSTSLAPREEIIELINQGRGTPADLVSRMWKHLSEGERPPESLQAVLAPSFEGAVVTTRRVTDLLFVEAAQKAGLTIEDVWRLRELLDSDPAVWRLVEATIEYAAMLFAATTETLLR